MSENTSTLPFLCRLNLKLQTELNGKDKKEIEKTEQAI